MEYLTDADYRIAEKNGISQKTAYQRFYRNGWTRKDTITKPTAVKNGLWEQYKDISVVSMTTFYSRVTKGMRPKEAALTPSRVKNKLTKEIVETAKKNGIGYTTLHQRVGKYKWPIEKAITQPVDASRRRKDIDRGKKD